jgi:hypothetical protein
MFIVESRPKRGGGKLSLDKLPDSHRGGGLSRKIISTSSLFFTINRQRTR